MNILTKKCKKNQLSLALMWKYSLFRISEGSLQINFGVIILLLGVFFTPHSSILALDNKCNEDSTKIIGKILYSGLVKTNKQVVLRELSQPQGQVFSCQQWSDDRKALEGLDVFSKIELKRSDSAGFINLEYQFTEMFSWMLLPAGKSSDQDGILLGLSLLNLNLWGRDIRVETQARTSISPLFSAREYMLQLSSPWLGPWPVEYQGVVVKTDSWNALKNYHESSFWEKIELLYWFTAHTGFKINFEWSQIAHDQAERSWLSSTNYDIVNLAGIGLVWDYRDRRVNPHAGVRQEIMVSRYFGDESSWEYIEDFRLWTNFRNRHMFHSNLLMRYRPHITGFHQMYHPGGGNSLRGFSADSTRLGASEGLFNLEYRYEFFDRKSLKYNSFQAFWGLQAVVGMDGAVVWSDQDLHSNDYYQSFYCGIHVLIPALDRLRFEYGFSKSEFRGVFTFSMFEKSVTQRWHSR